jgi:hypothetical protein
LNVKWRQAKAKELLIKFDCLRKLALTLFVLSLVIAGGLLLWVVRAHIILFVHSHYVTAFLPTIHNNNCSDIIGISSIKLAAVSQARQHRLTSTGHPSELSICRETTRNEATLIKLMNESDLKFPDN